MKTDLNGGEIRIHRNNLTQNTNACIVTKIINTSLTKS